ncbi:MAG: hypothetical protein JXA73_17020 [Acidobacteria bacterium]|nr:hypothetical protein [Acidobacteriota bacterium]
MYRRLSGWFVALTAMWILALGWATAGTISADRDLGLWTPPGGAQDAAAQLAFLNSTVLPAYNAAYDPDLPAAVYGTDNIEEGDVYRGVSFGDETILITLDVSGWTYLKLKWDGMWQFYYVAGLSDEPITFYSTAFNKNDEPQALSHYTYFGPTTVPDGGLTVLLLGIGVGGLALFSRRLR